MSRLGNDRQFLEYSWHVAFFIKDSLLFSERLPRQKCGSFEREKNDFETL